MILEIYIMRLRVGLLEIHAVGLSAFKIALFGEIQIWYLLYVKSKKKMTQMNFFLQNRNRLTDKENKLMITKEQNGRRDTLGVWD